MIFEYAFFALLLLFGPLQQTTQNERPTLFPLSSGSCLKVTYTRVPTDYGRRTFGAVAGAGMMPQAHLQAELAEQKGFLYIDLREGWAVYKELLLDSSGVEIQESLFFHGIPDSSGTCSTGRKKLEEKRPSCIFVPYSDWELGAEGETRQILGIVCRKAVVKNDRAQVEMTAWYARDLPVPYGPGRYGGGLPGLVLEMEARLYHFRATSIEQVKAMPFPKPQDFRITDMPFLPSRN